MFRARRGLIVAPIALLAACSTLTGISDFSVCEGNECADTATEAGGADTSTILTDAASSGSIDDADVQINKDAEVDAHVDAAIDAGCTNCDSGSDAPPPPPKRASCKELHELDNVVTDGVHTLANGKSVYCNMTLAGGGWTLIANTPPAQKGNWENTAQTLSTGAFITNLSVYGVMLPGTVDGQGLNYTEVLFFDTGLGNWFTVDSQSDFYRHNYQGACNDGLVIQNKSFSVNSRSNGGTLVYAWWGNGCPNNTDTITGKNQTCGDAFVNFDKSCISTAGGLLEAFVR